MKARRKRGRGKRKRDKEKGISLSSVFVRVCVRLFLSDYKFKQHAGRPKSATQPSFHKVTTVSVLGSAQTSCFVFHTPALLVSKRSGFLLPFLHILCHVADFFVSRLGWNLIVQAFRANIVTGMSCLDRPYTKCNYNYFLKIELLVCMLCVFA